MEDAARRADAEAREELLRVAGLLDVSRRDLDASRRELEGERLRQSQLEDLLRVAGREIEARSIGDRGEIEGLGAYAEAGDAATEVRRRAEVCKAQVRSPEPEAQ